MPVPFRIFERFTIFYRDTNKEVVSIRTEMDPMAVDWNLHSFLRSGSIFCINLWYRDLSHFLPNRYSRRILYLTGLGRSSQISKIQNPPLGVILVPFRLTVNYHVYHSRWIIFFGLISCCSNGCHLNLFDN